MKLLKYFFEAIFIYLSFLIIRILGLEKSRKLFSFIFIKLGKLFKKEEIINKNLKIFNKAISELKLEGIKNDMWSNYGMTFVEYIFLSKFYRENNHIEILGNENLSKVLHTNKPVIFVSGHFANFELMSMEITKNNIKLATIYRPLNNYFVNPLMEYLRKKYICKNQIKKGLNGVKESITYIKKGFSVALMIDQRVSEGERVKFFNKPALTTTLPAQLAFKFDLQIIPVFIERDKKNNFKMKFLEGVRPSEFENKVDLTKKLNEILEKMISNNPNQWIWTHNRWK